MAFHKAHLSPSLTAIAVLCATACATVPETAGADPVPVATQNDFGPVPISIHNDGVHIVGEIHTTEGSAPTTAMLMVGGSGAALRQDLIPALPMFLSDDVAITVFDRRGSGESTGVIERPGTLNSEWQIPILATDLAKLADELKAQGFTRVGVTGSSMGGWVSIAAAARTDSVDFVIAINGGASSVALSDAFDVLTDEGASIEEAIVHVQSLALAPSYAPDNDLSRLKQPVLWVLGEQDSSNPTALDVRVIEDWVSRGKDFQTLIVANADHNFLDIETGQPRLEWLAQARTFAVGDD